MQKNLLVIMLLVSTLYSDNNIIMVGGEMLIRGEGEECKVSMDKTGALTGTSCLQITNSKGIKILCTSNKKMCKAVDEMHDALNSIISPKTGISGLKALRQNMNYSEARKIILNSGWQASRKRWQDVPEEGRVNNIYYNNGWQEVADCAGTGTAPCRFEFKDINKKTLVVITEGECFDNKSEQLKQKELCDLSVSRWFFE